MVSFTQGIIYQFTTQICNWRLNAAKNMTKNITNKYMGKLFIHSFYSILMILIVPKVPDCIINCFLHFVKQFASTLIVKVEIILLHNGLFPDHVDFHVARDPRDFFATSILLHFLLCWVNLLLPVSQSQNFNHPYPHVFYFSWSWFPQMFLHGSVNLAHSYHRRQPAVGARPWPVFPASSQFVPNQPYEPCFGDFSSTSWSFIFARVQ